MEFLRRHAFYIICVLAGGGGIALAVTGLLAMPKVEDELQKAKRVYDQLDSLKSNPVNQLRIDAEAARIESTLEDRRQVFARAVEIYQYKPLVPEAFPDGDADARRRFRAEYEKSMVALFDSLGAGSTATEAEISLMRDKIENEAAAGGVTSRGQRFAGAPFTPAAVLTEAGCRTDPVARANIAAAQRYYCYAVHFRQAKPPRSVSSLEFDPMMVDSGTMEAPTPGEAWRAQVSYWIQKDVVDAIVAVNREAADAASKDGQPVWVGIMPVKDVISIRVSDYVVPDDDEYAGALPGDATEALPCGTPNTVFTHSATGEDYDVRQFTAKLVMDQRDIPRLVDRISKNSFHTLLRVAFKTVPPNKGMHGKIYGTEPTVNVVMDFETHMLAEVFRPMMPQEVCDSYDAIDCEPYRDEDELEEEDTE
ncbi:MAG: hypothetical protein ACE5HE_01330 [Phycisphaerae bacterium]